MGKFLLYPQDGKVRVTSPFGMRSGSMHRGVDLGSDNVGTDWNIAAADATVTRVGYEASGAGHWIEAKVDFLVSGKVAYIRYYHLKEAPHFYDRSRKPRIIAGDKLKQGEKIGIEGNTGHSSGSHLHFELRLGGNASSDAVDPVPYLWIPKELSVDGGALTQGQFKTVKYVENFKEETDMILKRGDSGAEVKAIQTGLMALGYSFGGYGADGEYGEITEAVVKKFQGDNKITVDGDVGPRTIAMLVNKLADQTNVAAIAKNLAKQIIAL